MGEIADICEEMREVIARHNVAVPNKGAVMRLTGLANRARQAVPGVGELAGRVVAAAEEFYSVRKHARRLHGSSTTYAMMRERIDRLEGMGSEIESSMQAPRE